MSSYLNWLDTQTDAMRETYKKLHRDPELGGHEEHTAAFVAGELRRMGFEVLEKVGGTGVVGTLRGREPGLTIALRSDMDALPMRESSGLPWASCRAGVTHACGHDANMTMTLFAAEAVARAGLARGTLKVVFQPAEELFLGARAVLAGGAISDVEEMVGVHLRPAAEARLGQAVAALRHGAARPVTIKIKGKSTHGARPHLGINTLDVAVNIVNAVYALHMNPAVGHSVTATCLNTNSAASNIVPDEAELVLDVRAAQNGLMREFLDKIERTARAVAEAAGAGLEFSVRGAPASEYDPSVVNCLTAAIEAVLGQAMEPFSTPGSEDFHYYAVEGAIRTAYLGLGADLEPGLHCPDMRFNLDVLPIGAKILARFVADKQGVLS